MDNDDLRRALARLERRERHRREHSSLASIELDAAGRIVAWNRKAEQVFGWTAAEIVGQRHSVLWPAAQRAEGVLEKLLHGDRRHINARRDGRTITCEWFVAPLEDDGGVVEIHCEVRDVSEAEVQRQRQRFMHALSDRSPLGIFAKHPDGHYLYANDEFARSVGLAPAEVIGRDDFAIFHPDIAASLRRHDAELLAADTPMTREDAGVGPDSGRTYWSLKFPLRDDAGELLAICGIVNDITPLRQAEHERTALQQRVIASQREALAELSTPLMPVAEGVLVMPLIGGIDRRRVEQIMETLLTAVVQQRARTVIIDITGVHSVDTQVAQALVAAAQGVRLLGSRILLSGINPPVAQTLVDLGVDLRGLVTVADLRTAVARALERAR
jgi:rsbT co-antagonist protein RsbR